MEVFEIEGGKKLSGTIAVSGLKNAATPIIAATLLSTETSVLENVPRIEDVFRMLEIVQSMGVRVEWQAEHTVAITPGDFHPRSADQEKVKKLRSSILLLGALAARFDSFELRQPGGCVIGARPVEAHLDALMKFGVHVTQKEKGYEIDAKERHPAKVVLRQMSVTATENAMMLAALLPGESIIKIAACEPHVVDLGHFLEKMGAKVEGLGTHTLRIVGTNALHGAHHSIIPDHNEAATYLILGAATKSEITVQHAREGDLDLVLEKLREFGVRFTIDGDAITVHPTDTLEAPKLFIDLRPYPGIPTDIQAPLAVLATQAKGETLVFDTLYEGRFNYALELEKMGAKLSVLNPHQVVITGPTALRGTVVKSYDLRGGAAVIIAALLAHGKTVIEDIYQVDRGYERIEERLQKIGAHIRRVEHT